MDRRAGHDVPVPSTASSSTVDDSDVADLATLAARTMAGPVPEPDPEPTPPTAGCPASGRPTSEQPASGRPTADTPVGGRSAGQEPAAGRPTADIPVAQGAAGEGPVAGRSAGESKAARGQEAVTVPEAGNDPGAAARPRPRRAVILLAPFLPTLQMVALVALVASRVDGLPAVVAGVVVACGLTYAVATALFAIGVLLGYGGSFVRLLFASLAALGAAFLFAAGPRINHTTSGRIKSWANASSYLKGAGLMTAHDLAVEHWLRLARAWSVRGTRDAVALYAYVLAERSRCAYWHRQGGRPAHDYIVQSLDLYESIDAFDDPELGPQARHAYEFLRQIDLGATSVRLWP